MPGRPRSFDETDALRRVGDVFRRHGYDGTTFAQLVASTGLSRSSLYNAFGDKDALFERASRLYLAEEIDPVVAGFDAGEAGAFEAFLETLGEPFDPDTPSGLYLRTLLENAATPERPRHAGLLGRTLFGYWERLAAVLFSRENSREKLNRPAAGSDRERAAMLVAVVLGAAVIARNGRNEELLRAVARGTRAVCD